MSTPLIFSRRGTLILLAAFAAAPMPAAVAPKPVRLLTIGNSFSANATRHLPALATAGGQTLIHKSIVVGGSPLQLHAQKALSHEHDPGDPKGLYADGKSLQHWLQSEPWDFVTIQQASIKSHDLSTYQPYARQLRDIIARYAPSAKLLVHQTWAYRSDDPRFKSKNHKAGEPQSQAAMHVQLSHAYRSVAAELGAGLIPVGDAFHVVATDSNWAYTNDPSFNARNARHPALPDQAHSLHVGWKWWKRKDGRMALRMDGHHANLAGEYVGACVWFERLFGTSVVGNSFVPKDLDAEFARYLQETAHHVAGLSSDGAAGGASTRTSAK